LIIGVLIGQGLVNENDRQIDPFYFRFAFGISTFFLVILLLAPIIIPFIHIQQNQNLPIEQQENILQAFKTYDSFILPVQGITMMSLGLFFTKKD
jgi:hypothetical protein